MSKDNINVQSFLNARTKEIEGIERCLENKKRNTCKFQEFPHYARRRNHSFLERKQKFKFRTKNRFLIRSHIYFAKRFKMLKILLNNVLDTKRSDVSIPWIRNIKSKSFINKAFSNGFFVDESFKQITKGCSEIDLQQNEFISDKTTDFIKTKNDFLQIDFREETFKQEKAIFRLFNIKEEIIKGLKQLVRLCNGSLYKNSNIAALDGYIVVCDVKKHMEMILGLEKMFIRAISIKEVSVLMVEKDKMSVYDYVDTLLFKKIDENIYKDQIDKYQRIPPGKKNKIEDLSEFKLYTNENVKYFIFKIEKGRAERSSNILDGENKIGKVVRSEYKRNNGLNYGLCYLYEEYREDMVMTVNNIGQSVKYKIKIIKEVK